MDKLKIKEEIMLQLNKIQNPSRYIGEEWNAAKDDFKEQDVNIALAFPDYYEVGMSNLGIRILYNIINKEEGMHAERIFTPADDLEKILREEGLPLFTLENFVPLKNFDLIGFSLPFELTYTNVLNILSLAEIPLKASERQEGPLIIGGGVCTFNAEPLADFFDLFVLGDGEESLPEIMRVFRENKNKQIGKEAMFLLLSAIPGVYIPSFYEPVYKNNQFSGIKTLKKKVPEKIIKRTLPDLDLAPYPENPVVSYRELVHDRAVLEISRGCTRGCRFCQAGTAYRPKRNRSVDNLKELAVKLIDNSGYDEISLSSLSSSDYPDIDKLVEELSEVLPQWVNLSLPSLRMDSFSIQLAAKVQKNRKSSLTFAPEAGTEKLRGIVNKNISDETIFQALDSAFKNGWRSFKFYFMIGLPGETDEDIVAIGDLMRKILVFYKEKRYSGNLKLSVSATVFVPKAHTPFQWEPQENQEELWRKQQLLAKSLHKIKLSWHDARMGLLEAVFARGDRRLGAVIHKAWQKGCKFDNMSDNFSFEKWQESFKEAGISPTDYACRRYDYRDPLPWDHLMTSIGKDYLIQEHEKSFIHTEC